MRFLVLPCFGYPSPTNLYNSGFIHIRVLAYKKAGYEVKVFVPNFKTNISDKYDFEGIEVQSGNKAALDDLIRDYQPDRLLVHFINIDVMSYISNSNFAIPTIIWVHGYEALSWHRILFEYKNFKQFTHLILTNIRQLFFLRKFIGKSENSNVSFVFVSKWMRDITTTDVLKKITNSTIIPNPIDSTLFNYVPKTAEARKHILLVRSFSSTKYANDVAIEAILKLSEKPFFNDLRFTIAGQGIYFNELTAPLEKFTNITLINKFLTQKEISAYHKLHGILLCPTRMDAQGVSMCEGMMSGLIPITSNNTAIPEFVENNVSGFLTNSSEEIASKISDLYLDSEKYLTMSHNAHYCISDIAGDEIVVQRELENIISFRIKEAVCAE